MNEAKGNAVKVSSGDQSSNLRMQVNLALHFLITSNMVYATPPAQARFSKKKKKKSKFEEKNSC